MSYYSYDPSFNYSEYEDDELVESDGFVPYDAGIVPTLFRRKRVTRLLDSVLDGMFHVLFLFLFLNFFFLLVIGPTVEKLSRDSMMRTFYRLVPDLFGDLTTPQALSLQSFVVPYAYANSQELDIKEVNNERLMDAVVMFFLVMVIALMPLCFWYVMNNKTHRLVKIFVFSILVLSVFGISEGLLYVTYLKNVRSVSEAEQTASMLKIVEERFNLYRDIPEKQEIYNEIQNGSTTHWQPIISIIVITTFAIIIPLICCVVFYPNYINPSSYRLVEQSRREKKTRNNLLMKEFLEWKRSTGR